MAVRDLLLLGNPDLYKVSQPVWTHERAAMETLIQDLHDTLLDARARHGIGQAIAAPQIGVFKRILYMHIDNPVVFFNPELSDLSEERVRVWDDCLCFPGLLVEVERHRTCTIAYKDRNWQDTSLSLHGDMALLLQHEVDHLDGILALARATGDRAFALKSERPPEETPC